MFGCLCGHVGGVGGTKKGTREGVGHHFNISSNNLATILNSEHHFEKEKTHCRNHIKFKESDFVPILHFLYQNSLLIFISRDDILYLPPY